MRIPQNFVEELKYRNKIDDVISSYVNLKRTGSNKTGLCPFHSEKTPSFTVFTNKDSLIVNYKMFISYLVYISFHCFKS